MVAIAAYIQEGSRGQGVICLQWALAFAVDPSLQKDGIVGPKTGDGVYYDDAQLGITPNCFPYIPTDGNCPAPACALRSQAVSGKTNE